MNNNLILETICELSFEEFSNKIASTDEELTEYFIDENINILDKYHIIDHFIEIDSCITNRIVEFFAWRKKFNKINLDLIEYILKNYNCNTNHIFNNYSANCFALCEPFKCNLPTIILFLNYGLDIRNIYEDTQDNCFDDIIDFKIHKHYNNQHELIYILSRCLEENNELFKIKYIVKHITKKLMRTYDEELFNFCIDHGMILNYSIFLDINTADKIFRTYRCKKFDFILTLLKKIKSEPEFFNGDIRLINVIIYTAIKFRDVKCIEYIISNDFSFEEIKSAIDMYSEPNPGIELIINKFSTELSIVDIVNLCTDNIKKIDLIYCK